MISWLSIGWSRLKLRFGSDRQRGQAILELRRREGLPFLMDCLLGNYPIPVQDDARYGLHAAAAEWFDQPAVKRRFARLRHIMRQHPDGIRRYKAARIIRDVVEISPCFRVRETTDACLHSLRDSNDGVCWMAAEALGFIGDPAAVPGLIPLLENRGEWFVGGMEWERQGKSNQLAVSAAKSLGRIGDRRAIGPLLRMHVSRPISNFGPDHTTRDVLRTMDKAWENSPEAKAEIGYLRNFIGAGLAGNEAWNVIHPALSVLKAMNDPQAAAALDSVRSRCGKELSTLGWNRHEDWKRSYDRISILGELADPQAMAFVQTFRQRCGDKNLCAHAASMLDSFAS